MLTEFYNKSITRFIMAYNFSIAMYGGICICLLLAMLSASSTGQQTVGSLNEDLGTRETEEQNLLHHPRYIRASSGQLKTFPRIDGNGDQKANLGAILAKYLQTRKGKIRLLY